MNEKSTLLVYFAIFQVAIAFSVTPDLFSSNCSSNSETIDDANSLLSTIESNTVPMRQRISTIRKLEVLPPQLYSRRLIAFYEQTSHNELKHEILKSIMRNGEPGMIPICIKMLRSKDERIMNQACLTLNAIVHFQDYDFGKNEPFIAGPSIKQTSEEKEKAIREWEKWWKENENFQPTKRKEPSTIEAMMEKLDAKAEVYSDIALLSDETLSPKFRAEIAEELRKKGIIEGNRCILPEVLKVQETLGNEDVKKDFFSIHNDYAKQALIDIIYNQKEYALLRSTCINILRDVATRNDVKDILAYIGQEDDETLQKFMFQLVRSKGGPENIPQLLMLAREGRENTRVQALKTLAAIGINNRLPGTPHVIVAEEKPGDLDKLYSEWQEWWDSYVKEQL